MALTFLGSLISGLVPDICLWLGTSWFNLSVHLALTICELWSLFFSDSLLIVTPLAGFCNCSILVVPYFISILVLESSLWGRESGLVCLVCLPGVLWLLCVSSSQCHGFACCLWRWYFLILLTYYFSCIQYTVESLYLFCLLLIFFVCTRRSYIDEVGIFYANQTSIYDIKS